MIDTRSRRAFLASSLAAGMPAFPQQKSAAKKMVIVLLGPPGAGKSTQAKAVKRVYGLPTISAAELLKKHHGDKSEISKALKIGYASGALLNDEGLNELVRERTLKGDALDGFILDGYPSSKTQAQFLNQWLAERHLPTPAVVHLKAPDEVVRARMMSRRRADDKPEIIDARLAEYRRDEGAVLELFPADRVIAIDGTPAEKDVTKALLDALAKFAF
jgi:adenylate kinase